MQWRWVQHTGANDLIVVFGGWALGPAPFAHLTGPYDVVLADDYRDLSQKLPDVEGYQSVTLVAFSFGVAAYGHWQQGQPDPFSRKVAINGTLSPIDRRCGIAPVVMQRTIDTLSHEAFQIFLERCYNTPQSDTPLDVTTRKQELRAVESRGTAPDVSFDRVWISDQDRIFLPANQQRAWADQVERVQHIDAPHVPFKRWSTWAEVLA
jgi:pimeloyl-[acyl-carrier protein] methyl ester esterase